MRLNEALETIPNESSEPKSYRLSDIQRIEPTENTTERRKKGFFNTIKDHFLKQHMVMTGFPVKVEGEKNPPMSIQERAARGYGTGLVSVAEGFGGALKAFGGMEQKVFGTMITMATQRAKEKISVPDPKFVDQVASGFGSITAFYLPGLGIAKGAQALSFAPKIANIFGATASGVFESLIESGSTYEQAIAKGMDEKGAHSAASFSFLANLPATIITNKLGLFGEVGPAPIRTILSGGFEGLQEVFQEIIGNVSVADDAFQNTAQAFGVGLITGGSVKGVQMAISDMKQLSEAKEIKESLPKESRSNEETVLQYLAKEDIATLGEQTDTEKYMMKAIRVKATGEVFSKEASKKSMAMHFGIVEENNINQPHEAGYLDAEGNFTTEQTVLERPIEGKEISTEKPLQTRAAITQRIKDQKFEKLDNFRHSLKLPAITKMTDEQLQGFEESLKPFEKEDVFLTQKQLQTVDKTDLKGIKTLREAKERLSEQIGMPIEELNTFKVSEIDEYRYNTSLAEKNPFYKMLVEESGKELLIGEAKALKIEQEINDLTKKARKSKKRTVKGKIVEALVPTDELVFQYLEAENKQEIAKQMTKEELKLAENLREKFADALAYLVKTETLKGGRENYITNIRRDFFEATKEDGIVQAFKEVFNQYKLDEQKFDILNEKTGYILPLEKFFQFSLRRTGGMKPSQNVAKASTTYFRTLEKKKALDSLIPKLSIYTDALTTSKVTATGLAMDDTIKTFVKKWINTKKGRPVKLFMKPGGKIDIGVKAAKAFVTIKDLGLSIPLGIATNIGETVATYASLGKKHMALGIARGQTAKGKRIIKKYKNFIGKGLIEEITEPSNNLGDKFSMTLFGLFKSSNVRANKISLLASMTKEEYRSETISEERMSAIQTDMGRWRTLPGSKSIMGSTTEGGIMTQYKSWAIPILRTVSKDITTIAGKVRDGRVRGLVTSREARELLRAAEITTVAILASSALGDDDRKDKSFLAQLLRKARRESLTILGALDPEMILGEPRLLAWAAALGDSLKMLLKLEKYKAGDKKGTLKGDDKLLREITPSALKQFQGKDKETTTERRPSRSSGRKRTKRSSR